MASLTLEIAAERGIKVDEEGFKRAMEEQQRRAREAAAFSDEIFKKTAEALDEILERHGLTEFTGYYTLEDEGDVLLILVGEEAVERLGPGEKGVVVLSKIYAEGGGQIGDFGVFEWEGGRARVETTKKSPQGLHLHYVEVEEGELVVGQRVRAKVDPRRRETERHHTATHLLHAALRAVLGPHARQAGSLVAPDRLRFDFTHPEPLTPEEIRKIELLVNRWIQADFPVTWEVMPLEEAKKQGAVALFGEKYGEEVRVVRVEGAAPSAGIVEGEVRSMELCGGCHVRRTGEIGYFLIKSEEGVSAGVRRIEALVGESAVRYARGVFDRVALLAGELGATPETLAERVERLRAEAREKDREIERLKRELARAQLGGERRAEVKEAGPWRYAAAKLSGLDMPGLRQAADALLAETGADLVAVGSEGMLVIKASREATERGLSAAAVMRELAGLAGGRGGGKPQLAQGGGFDLDLALAKLAEVLEKTA